MPPPCLTCFRSLYLEPSPSENFRVKIIREEGKPLGFLVAFHSMVQGLVIQDVRDDSVAAEQWRRQRPESPMEIGQAIIEINERTSLDDMMDVLHSSNEFDMLISTTLTPSQRWTLLESSKRTIIETALDKMSSPPEVGEVSCAICLEDMDDLSLCVRLPCHHSFHQMCVQRWLMRGNGFRCPLCNQTVDLDRAGE